MRIIQCVILLLIAALPNIQPAFAHARWFVAPENALDVSFHWDACYGWMITGAVLFALVMVSVDIIGFSSQRRNNLIHRSFVPPAGFLDWRIVTSLLGFMLIMNSMTRVFLAPNIPIDEFFLGEAAYFAQIVLGAMLLLQTRVLLAAFVITLLPILGLLIWPFDVIIDYFFEFTGVGIALMMIAPSLTEHDQRIYGRLRRLLPQSLRVCVHTSDGPYELTWSNRLGPDCQLSAEEKQSRENLALHIIRTALGLQLIVLATHNKLLNPGLSLAFVEQNSFINFMPSLGLTDFTNLHFVFAAGIAELTFGLLLVTNVATRVTSAVVMTAFIIPVFLFGPEEIFGHLPILGVLAILFVRGSGDETIRAVVERPSDGPSPAAGVISEGPTQ